MVIAEQEKNSEDKDTANVTSQQVIEGNIEPDEAHAHRVRKLLPINSDEEDVPLEELARRKRQLGNVNNWRVEVNKLSELMIKFIAPGEHRQAEAGTNGNFSKKTSVSPPTVANSVPTTPKKGSPRKEQSRHRDSLSSNEPAQEPIDTTSVAGTSTGGSTPFGKSKPTAQADKVTETPKSKNVKKSTARSRQREFEAMPMAGTSTGGYTPSGLLAQVSTKENVVGKTPKSTSRRKKTENTTDDNSDRLSSTSSGKRSKGARSPSPTPTKRGRSTRRKSTPTQATNRHDESITDTEAMPPPNAPPLKGYKIPKVTIKPVESNEASLEEEEREDILQAMKEKMEGLGEIANLEGPDIPMPGVNSSPDTSSLMLTSTPMASPIAVQSPPSPPPPLFPEGELESMSDALVIMAPNRDSVAAPNPSRASASTTATPSANTLVDHEAFQNTTFMLFQSMGRIHNCVATLHSLCDVTNINSNTAIFTLYQELAQLQMFLTVFQQQYQNRNP